MTSLKGMGFVDSGDPLSRNVFGRQASNASDFLTLLGWGRCTWGLLQDILFRGLEKRHVI